jgi:hypothetical protein
MKLLLVCLAFSATAFAEGPYGYLCKAPDPFYTIGIGLQADGSPCDLPVNDNHLTRFECDSVDLKKTIALDASLAVSYGVPFDPDDQEMRLYYRLHLPVDFAAKETFTVKYSLRSEAEITDLAAPMKHGLTLTCVRTTKAWY